MAGGSRKNADHTLLMALVCGATIENAAKTAGVSERTAHRRLKDPEFAKKLQDMRAEMVQRAAGMLTAAAMEAVKTLLALQKDNTPPAVRLGAARAVLELGMKLRESSELADRIAALEEEIQIQRVELPRPSNSEETPGEKNDG